MNIENPIILDNVIPEKYQSEIEHTLTQIEFDWHLNKSVSYGASDITKEFIEHDKNIKDTRGFIHRFLVNNIENTYVKSQYCDFVRPLLFFVEEQLKFQINNIDRIRGVLIPKDIEMRDSYNVPHLDSTNPHYTLIYYVNDNDGGTLLFEEKGPEVSSSKKTPKTFIPAKKGRVLLFDGLTYHTGIVPSDNDKILININFV